MPVNLSIKRVPDKLVAKLRKRAAANHRSLQGELLSLLEDAVENGARSIYSRPITVEELRRRVKRLGLRTPDEATEMIREDRGAR